MSNQLSFLLNVWQKGKLDTDWVIGTVYKTEGSAYRKAGAMMLINGYGQQFGLLSGGCLEADILLSARKVMRSRKVLLLVYDDSDEDDWSYQVGIGCGGKVYIMLQPLTPKNDLSLGAMARELGRRNSGIYHQKIGALDTYFEVKSNSVLDHSYMELRSDGEWLLTPTNPEPHLLIVGGGADARPLANLASELGWHITLVDPRVANARAEYFPNVKTIIHELDGRLSRYIGKEKVDAVVIMSHNIEIDAKALRCCQDTDLDYIALLGPRHRFKRVLEKALLTESQLTTPVSAPAGLSIGGQLPESIALSILAECHTKIYKNQSIQLLQI